MLLIRHAQKEYANGKSSTYEFDPDITDKGRELAKEKFQQLVKDHGKPNLIVSSPFYRARQTVNILRELVDVPIIVDREIGEYLGNQQGKNIVKGLREETISAYPIVSETFNQFTNRIKKYTKSIENIDMNIWVITHGLVIQTIAKTTGNKINYPDSLCGIKIQGSKISEI